MYVVVIVLTVIVSILLIGIVLIQKSKGGGLSSQFGNASSVMGVRQTNSFLEKTTWTLAGLIVFLSIVSAYTMPKVSDGTQIRTTTSAPAPRSSRSRRGTCPVIDYESYNHRNPEAQAPVGFLVYNAI